MPAFQNVKGLSESGETFIKVLLSKDFNFFQFNEEPEYSVYESFPKGQTARYHFIEMITEGGHGYTEPMTNFQIRSAHPDLTDSEIDSLRKFYNDNKNRRPFKFPFESTRPFTDVSLINGVNQNEQDFVLYFGTTRPVIESTGITFEYSLNSGQFVTKSNVASSIKGSNSRDIKYVNTIIPPVANVGQYWMNTSSGRIYVYMTDGITNAWVEV